MNTYKTQIKQKQAYIRDLQVQARTQKAQLKDLKRLEKLEKQAQKIKTLSVNIVARTK